MSAAHLQVLFLKKSEDRRLRAGHTWVFSNEVDVARSPLSGFATGQQVLIADAAGKPLGVGYVNPNALICARLVTRRSDQVLNRELIIERLQHALVLRERLYAGEPFYRLIFGESDGLPGLVLDRYNDVIVGQIGTAGMEALRDQVVEAVTAVLGPRAMIWKNNGSVRQLEGLPEYTEVAIGSVDGPVAVREGGLAFTADPLAGQKTGWFFDQRANRDLLAPYVRGCRVLDVFSYVGAWGIRAAAAGAREVVCVDASAQAVAAVMAHAATNQLADRVEARQADAFEELRRLRSAGERFDVVILDPPAFIKRKKDMAAGTAAYRRINELALRLLARDGVLISCSCSYHMPRAMLIDTIAQAARQVSRQLQVLAELQQAPDHPVLPALPETQYLKGAILRAVVDPRSLPGDGDA